MLKVSVKTGKTRVAKTNDGRKMKTKKWISILVAAGFLAAIPCRGSIVSVSGSWIKLLTGAQDFSKNGLKSDTEIYLEQEQEGFVLNTNLHLDVTAPGSYDKDNFVFSTTNLPAGTIADSYILHAQPDNKKINETNRITTITFDRDIIGVIVDRTSLTNSDYAVGNSANTYAPPPNGRNFSVTEHTDTFTLSSDRRSLSIDAMYVGVGWGDQLRIITVPEPAAISLIALFSSFALIVNRWLRP